MRKRTGVITYLIVGLLALGLLLPSGVALADEPEAITPVEKSVFTDVNDNHDQLVYINYINARNIMNGFPDGSFNPAAGLTRAEAAVIMCKTANLNTQDQEAVSAFTDVTTEHWAYNYINAAVKAGYLQGLGDGTYQPDASLTRAQAISLILRLSTSKDSGVPLPALNDMDIDHWAARAMAMAIDAQMISSKGNNIQPDQPISRSDITQALAILLTREPNLASVPLYGILKVNSGEVMLSRGGQEGVLVTSARQVEAGDTITTLDKASAQINFPDGSSLLLKPKSELTIQTAQGRAYIKQNGKPGTAIDDLQVKLQVGTMFGALSDLTVAAMEDAADEDATVTAWKKGLTLLAANTDTPEEEPPWYKTAEKKKVKVKVDMPWGVAAIRGTFWQNTVDDDGSGSMSVLQGSGSVTSGGQTTNIDPGQSTNGAPAQPPTPPAPMTPEQARGWAGEQGWVNSTVGNMSNNVGAPPPSAPPTNAPTNNPPPAPSQMMENLNQNINNAMQQVQQTAQSNTSTSQSSGSSSSGGSSLPQALFDVSYRSLAENTFIPYTTSSPPIELTTEQEGLVLQLESNIIGIDYTYTNSDNIEIGIESPEDNKLLMYVFWENPVSYPVNYSITITASAPGHQSYTRTINLTVMEYNPAGLVLERIIVNDEGSGVDHTVYDSLTFRFSEAIDVSALGDSLTGDIIFGQNTNQEYYLSVPGIGYFGETPDDEATIEITLSNSLKPNQGTSKDIIFMIDRSEDINLWNIQECYTKSFTVDNENIENNGISITPIAVAVMVSPTTDSVTIKNTYNNEAISTFSIRIWGYDNNNDDRFYYLNENGQWGAGFYYNLASYWKTLTRDNDNEYSWIISNISYSTWASQVQAPRCDVIISISHEPYTLIDTKFSFPVI